MATNTSCQMTLITQLIEIIQNLQQMHDEKLKLELTKDIAKILIPSQELLNNLMEEMNIQMNETMKAKLNQFEKKIERQYNIKLMQLNYKTNNKLNILKKEIYENLENSHQDIETIKQIVNTKLKEFEEEMNNIHKIINEEKSDKAIKQELNDNIVYELNNVLPSKKRKLHQ